jgi:hypothetical protein
MKRVQHVPFEYQCLRRLTADEQCRQSRFKTDLAVCTASFVVEYVRRFSDNAETKGLKT